MSRASSFGAVLLAALLLIAAPASAQVADAVIEVILQDESQAFLPGVTVTVTRPDTGYTQHSVTDAAGVVRFIALQPGTYTVVAELSGFNPVSQEGVTVRVGQTARLTVTLKVGGVSETVNVVAEAPLLDVYKTDSSTNIVPEQIESLPVPNRDFQSLAFLAPGVQRERGTYRFIQNSPVIGAGGNASQSTIMVDGVDFTDPTLGLARAKFSQDAISEFRVIANRFDSEIGGSAGGALSVVTKTGTNDLRGSVFSFFRDDALRARGEFDLQKNDYSRQQFGGTIGGPIAKDKTHFFASVEQINEDAITLFRPGGAYASLAEDVPVPLNSTLLYGGIDSRFTDTQNLRTRFVYERQRLDNFRVGGVADASSGFEMQRDNWNMTATHGWTISNTTLNQISFQAGRRKFGEPNNSTALSEYFSSGNTLVTGANITGEQYDTGDIVEIRDTLFTRFGSGTWAIDLKAGGAWQWVRDDWDFPVYPQDLMIYVTDTRALPLIYVDASGVGRSTITTNLLSGFVQADVKPSPRFSLNVGVRYDLDTAGNNPDYTDTLHPTARGKDTNNVQPRAGFSWDLTGRGTHVIRGGAGLFTGRFLLVPAHIELQQNSYTGRIIQQRLNGALLGLPPAFWLDASNPTSTGIPLTRDVGGIDTSFVNPRATQVSAGYTVKLGSTGLFADFEGVYVKGEDEVIIRDVNWRGNSVGGCVGTAATCRPNVTRNQINWYTNEGRSEYKAFVASLNGVLKGGHLVTASLTVADKKNINDDFSPVLTDYPNDPANIEAEWGRSRADERIRFTASAVVRLPWRFTVAPIVEYGSGQPWNRRRGYDFNGDGKNSDRLPGVGRFSEDGPAFAQVNLRITYGLPLGSRARADLIAEFFNLLNRDNFDVNSVQNSEFLSGPTLANPALPAVQNPRYRQFTATLPPFEAQLGVRVVF
ncbi:MAG: carboxypeptidase regulatory-like domain-containing protein [Acidobacteriota bacterium]